jgi:flavoprotein
MGKSAVKKKCARCQKEFTTKPKKVKTRVNDKLMVHWEEEDYCQRCRHGVIKMKQMGIKEKLDVRVRERKVDIKKEVETLRRMENYNPALLEKLRREKYESKES